MQAFLFGAVLLVALLILDQWMSPEPAAVLAGAIIGGILIGRRSKAPSPARSET